MLKLFLWLRYLRKRKIVLLSIAALTLSTALLIVVASLFAGFIAAFEQSAVDAIGDAVLGPPAKFTDYQELISRLEQTAAVKAATPTLTTQGLLHLGRGNVRAVEIWGIEPDKRGAVTAFDESLLIGKAVSGGQDNGIARGFVGIGALAEPDEQTDEYDFEAAKKFIGQQVVITTGSAGKNAESDQQKFTRRVIKFELADVVFTGVYHLDKRIVYLPIERLAEALGGEPLGPGPQQVCDQLQIKLRSGVDVDVALAQIRGVWEVFAADVLGWSGYLVHETNIETATQLQSRFVAELRKQMGILLLIFGVISFSVVVLIFCIFYMIVETRRKDIGILKSCGAASGSVWAIFVGFGGCVGAIGAGLGMVLGWAVTQNINVIEEWIRVLFGLKLWKSSVYMFSRIPNEVDWTAALQIAAAAVLAAAAGALIPAIVAALTRPVNVLRYE